jgi:hypothetical protein
MATPIFTEWLSEWQGFGEDTNHTPNSQIQTRPSSNNDPINTGAKPNKPPEPHYNVLPKWWLQQHVAKADECPVQRIVLGDCNCAAKDGAKSLSCTFEPGSYMMHKDLYMEALYDLWRFLDTESITSRCKTPLVVLRSAANEPVDYLDTVVENLAFDLGVERVSFGPMELADFASDLFRERLFESSDGSFLQLACKSDDEEREGKWWQSFAEWWDFNDDIANDGELESASVSSDVTDVDVQSDSHSESDEDDEDHYDDRPGLSSWDVCLQRSVVLHRLFRKFLDAVESKVKRSSVWDVPYFKRNQPRYSEVRAGGLVIHVRELDRVRSHKIADKMMGKLERLIQRERMLGKNILLVGTAEREADSPYSAWGLFGDDLDERRLVIISPACRHHQEQLRATHASWIRENNTRLLKSMFRSGIVAARELELFQPLTKWPLGTDSVLRQQLCSQRLPFNFWRRIVTNAEWKLSTPAEIKLVDLELTVRRTKLTARLRSGIPPKRPSSSGKLTLQAKGGSKITGGGGTKNAPTTIDLEKLKKDCNQYEKFLLDGVVEAGECTYQLV